MTLVDDPKVARALLHAACHPLLDFDAEPAYAAWTDLVLMRNTRRTISKGDRPKLHVAAVFSERCRAFNQGSKELMLCCALRKAWSLTWIRP